MSHTVPEIQKALNDGIAAGQHDITYGNVFRSAWPTARDYGYHGTLHDIFTAGYLSVMPAEGVTVDADGRTKAEQGGHVSTLDVPAVNGYDYKHQAAVVNGHYVRCGHALEGKSCDCYGTIHRGELPAADADIH